jgi:hypothetical protein
MIRKNVRCHGDPVLKSSHGVSILHRRPDALASIVFDEAVVADARVAAVVVLAGSVVAASVCVVAFVDISADNTETITRDGMLVAVFASRLDLDDDGDAETVGASSERIVDLRTVGMSPLINIIKYFELKYSHLQSPERE